MIIPYGKASSGRVIPLVLTLLLFARVGVAQPLPVDDAAAAPVMAPIPGPSPRAPDAPPDAQAVPTARAVEAPAIEVNAPTFTTGVGQAVTMTVAVTLPSGAQLVTAAPARNAFVETVKPTVVEDESATLHVAVFRPGTYVFTVDVVWLDAEGQQHRHASAPLSLQVQSSIAADADPSLSAPGAFVLLRSKNIWLMGMTAGALVALLVAAGVLAFRRRKRLPAVEEPPPPARPAWIVALEEIRRLQADDLLAQEEHLAFHMRLSEILRQWLEGRFQISALEMTTEEIRLQLDARRLDAGLWIDAIEQILADTDVVKFARFAPPVTGSRHLLEQLEALIREVQTSDVHGADIPEPMWDEPSGVVDTVRASPQPQAPGEAGAPRASQEPLPDNVIRFSPRGPRQEDER